MLVLIAVLTLLSWACLIPLLLRDPARTVGVRTFPSPYSVPVTTFDSKGMV